MDRPLLQHHPPCSPLSVPTCASDRAVTAVRVLHAAGIVLLNALPARLIETSDVARLRLPGSMAELAVILAVNERSSSVAVTPTHVTPSHVVPVQGPVP